MIRRVVWLSGILLTACVGTAAMPERPPPADRGAVGAPATSEATEEREVRAPPPMENLDAIEAAIARGFREEADRALEAFVEGADAGRAHLLRSRIALETTRFGDAARYVRSASKHGGSNAEIATLRGEIAEAEGQYSEAERAYEEARASDPSAYRARVLLGRLRMRQGRTAEGESVLLELVEAYNDGSIGDSDGPSLAYVAMAARSLGAYRDANEAFQKSTRAAPDRIETQLEWAELFFEKYDLGHAEESLRHALELDESSPRAHLLRARLLIAQTFDFREAERSIEEVLRVAPRTKAAYAIRAGMAVRDGRYDDAARALEEAYALDPEYEETASVDAALASIRGDEARFSAIERKVLARNPRASRFYTTVAEILEFEHRYPTIVRLAHRATAIAPEDGLAWATLGINLLRSGEEKEGLLALRTAWKRDRYHVQVYNLLNLYDDVIANEYEDVSSPPFLFRFHREERAILERYVPRTLGQAFESMKSRYGFAPTGPIRLEMYGDPEHFAVRTIGLPRLGVQGVCFGNVVTAISPRGGPFNWGQITWHELAHVFHIHLSKHRVPRWFTEGLAEYETNVARPEWRRELAHRLVRALENGTLPSLAEMNRAFTTAESAEALSVAYDASARAVTYLVEQYGFPAVVSMLRAWGEGRDTEEVFRRALGVTIDRVNDAFVAHLRTQLAPWRGQVTIEHESRGDAGIREKTGEGSSGREEGAERQLLLAKRDLEAKKLDAAKRRVDAILKGGRDGYEVRLLLSRIHLARGEVPAAKRALRRATQLDGHRPEAWLALSMLGEREGDREAQIEALTHLAMIEEHDREINAALLTLLHQQGRSEEVVRFGEMALLLDPARAESHRLLAEGYLNVGRSADALFEFDSARLLGAEPHAQVLAGRALALAQLGRTREAKAVAAEATTLDPSVAARLTSVLEAK